MKAKISVKINQLKTQATANLITGELTAKGDAADLTPLKEEGNNYKALIIPQAAGEGVLITVNVDGKDYLLEKPLRADIALVGASLGDKAGNLVYRGTSQNFNPLMASAADLVIAEINELVEVGEIAAENVKTPSIMVDFIIEN